LSSLSIGFSLLLGLWLLSAGKLKAGMAEIAENHAGFCWIHRDVRRAGDALSDAD